MAAKYLMQAQDISDGHIKTWRSATPDFSGTGFPGTAGAARDITVSGGGFDTGTSAPDGAFVLDDGSYVVFDDGSFAVSS